MIQTACSKRQATGALKKSLNGSASRAHFFAGAKSLRKTGHHPRIKSEGGLFRDHALLKTPRLTALRCAPARRRLRIAEAAAEQPREEVAAIVLITALIVTTLVVAWRHRGGATTIAFAAIDRTFGNLPFLAPQDRDQNLVAAVHVFAEFQTAVIVDERRLVCATWLYWHFYVRTFLVSTAVKDYATARGRLGLAFDRFLVFGTGGWAWGNPLTSYALVGAAPFFNNDGSSTGWTAGLGVDYAFTDSVVGRI